MLTGRDHATAASLRAPDALGPTAAALACPLAFAHKHVYSPAAQKKGHSSRRVLLGVAECTHLPAGRQGEAPSPRCPVLMLRVIGACCKRTHALCPTHAAPRAALPHNSQHPGSPTAPLQLHGAACASRCCLRPLASAAPAAMQEESRGRHKSDQSRASGRQRQGLTIGPHASRAPCAMAKPAVGVLGQRWTSSIPRWHHPASDRTRRAPPPCSARQAVEL
jgi:hypothetical protein